MLQLARDSSKYAKAVAAPGSGEYGAWTGYQIQENRTDWHPLVRSFYEYWLSVSPPGRLPGRQHIAPEEVPVLWSRMWMLDVHRSPLRYRYRLCGTEMVRSLGREVTGLWLDEIHPQLIANPQSRERLHIAAEDSAALWSRSWMLDVHRNPLRYRYRLCGTEMVRSLGREVTGLWLDEIH